MPHKSNNAPSHLASAHSMPLPHSASTPRPMAGAPAQETNPAAPAQSTRPVPAVGTILVPACGSIAAVRPGHPFGPCEACAFACTPATAFLVVPARVFIGVLCHADGLTSHLREILCLPVHFTRFEDFHQFGVWQRSGKETKRIHQSLYDPLRLKRLVENCRSLRKRSGGQRSQPTMQPTLDPTCTYLERLTQPSVTCKLLNVQDSYRLKRLASGVQLPPWPPSFQRA